mmetsp:Transcript_13709/g.28319  ORF Transcript_13709/g.28319 Transcript_13709/m.28319 type:complete len:264 (+) Transcript_13709:62-853(+)
MTDPCSVAQISPNPCRAIGNSGSGISSSAPPSIMAHSRFRAKITCASCGTFPVPLSTLTISRDMRLLFFLIDCQNSVLFGAELFAIPSGSPSLFRVFRPGIISIQPASSEAVQTMRSSMLRESAMHKTEFARSRKFGPVFTSPLILNLKLFKSEYRLSSLKQERKVESPKQSINSSDFILSPRIILLRTDMASEVEKLTSLALKQPIWLDCRSSSSKIRAHNAISHSANSCKVVSSDDLSYSTIARPAAKRARFIRNRTFRMS